MSKCPLLAVCINATIDRESLIQGSFRFPRMKREKGSGLLPSEEITGSLASILKSVVPISSMVSDHYQLLLSRLYCFCDQIGKPSLSPIHPDYVPSIFLYQTCRNTKSAEDCYWRAVKRAQMKYSTPKQVSSEPHDIPAITIETSSTNDTLSQATSEAEDLSESDAARLTSDLNVRNSSGCVNCIDTTRRE